MFFEITNLAVQIAVGVGIAAVAALVIAGIVQATIIFWED